MVIQARNILVQTEDCGDRQRILMTVEFLDAPPVSYEVLQFYPRERPHAPTKNRYVMGNDRPTDPYTGV